MHPDRTGLRNHLRMNAAKIFVTDDNADNAKAAAMLLRVYGWQARTFTDARECLDAALKEPPACILTDLNMPGMDGIALIESLSSNGLEVPVIVITGATPDSPELRRARELAYAIVRKTHEAAELEPAVRQALAKEDTRRPRPDGPTPDRVGRGAPAEGGDEGSAP